MEGADKHTKTTHKRRCSVSSCFEIHTQAYGRGSSQESGRQGAGHSACPRESIEVGPLRLRSGPSPYAWPPEPDANVTPSARGTARPLIRAAVAIACPVAGEAPPPPLLPTPATVPIAA